jgi:glycosyltransferase involved in cell wall biosynthesis
MRILHTIAGLHESSGGPSETTSALCEELATHGLSVGIVTQRSREIGGVYRVPNPALVTTRFVESFYLAPLRVAYSPRLLAIIRHACEDQRIELLHDHGIWLPINHAATRVAREKGIPLVVSPRGMLEPWALAYRAWKKRVAWTVYEKRNLSSARAFCATSSEEARSIRDCGLRQPVAVVPNGVKLPELKERHVERTGLRTALFLSRIHPVKGLLLLVEAWRRVQPQDWRVIVAGPDEGGHRKAVEEAIRAAGLEVSFEFVGPVRDDAKAALLQQAGVLILPTMSENFGVVVAEALAHGVPVITTTGAPWSGLLEHACGWWVRPKVEDLASAIREAIALSETEREAMGARGRLWMERDFSWPSVARRMLSFYEWIVNGGRVPDCVIERQPVSYSIGTKTDFSHPMVRRES